MQQTSAAPDAADLNLLRPWREPASPTRILAAGIGSLGAHMLFLILLLWMPGVPPAINSSPPDLKRAVHLTFPRDLTQREANVGKVLKQLDIRSAGPPAPVPQAPRFRAPQPVAGIPASAPAIEAPKIEAGNAPPPPASIGNLPQVTPPVEKPKLTLQDVGSRGASPRPAPDPNIKLPQPKSTVEETLRATAPSTGPLIPPGNQAVGDPEDAIPSPNAAPSSGPARSNLQLLSDPKGVDFKPYMLQVLAAVRRNWLAVIPESARMGRKGRVVIQFSVDRHGKVPKLVIAEASGTEAFDRAAVAGISASNPFPDLPADFKGDQIRLQLAFSYNVPSR